MLRIVGLAGLIVALGFGIEYLLVIRWGVFHAIPYQDLQLIAYALIAAPVIEETVRYGVLRNLDMPLQSATRLGLLIGLAEFAIKALRVPEGVSPLLNAVVSATSVPIHVALSCAFFSFAAWRLPKTMALHAALNLIGLASTVAFAAARAAPIPFTVGVLAVTTVACSWLINNRSRRYGAA